MAGWRARLNPQSKASPLMNCPPKSHRSLERSRHVFKAETLAPTPIARQLDASDKEVGQSKAKSPRKSTRISQFAAKKKRKRTKLSERDYWWLAHRGWTMIVIGSGVCVFILMVVLTGVIINGDAVVPDGAELCPPKPVADQFYGRLKC